MRTNENHNKGSARNGNMKKENQQQNGAKFRHLKDPYFILL